MTKIQEIAQAVEEGKTKAIASLVQEALDSGDDAAGILESMIGAMGVIGDKFSAGEVFVPEMLVSAKTMQNGVEVLKPIFAEAGKESLGTCIIGTVAGDLHDIGKNLVALMIESAGFDVIDAGIDVPASKFIQTIKENPQVKVVALSGLLTMTMPSVEQTVKAIRDSGLSGFKIIVGGAPLTEKFAQDIGADAYAPDAGSAAVKSKELALLVQKD